MPLCKEPARISAQTLLLPETKLSVENFCYCMGPSLLGLVYNSVGFVSKVFEDNQRKHWKLPLSTTPLYFDPPLQRTPANISINVILPETSHYIFFIIHIFVQGCENRMFCAIECVMTVQDHPRSWFWHQPKARMRLPIIRRLHDEASSTSWLDELASWASFTS